MKTIQELCRNALGCQDAVNLSAVVHSFSRDITDLRAHMTTQPDFSTDKLNRHPMSVMYSSKIASLTGSEDVGDFSRAYAECEELAFAPTPAEEAEDDRDQLRAEINANTQ